MKSITALRCFLFIALMGAAALIFVRSPSLVMVLILIAVLGYSGSLNLIFIIFDERVPTEIAVAMFEIAMAIAQFFTAFAPTIGMLKPPLPMAIVIGFAAGTLFLTY